MQIWVVNSRGNTKIRVTIKSASRKHYFNSYMLGSEKNFYSFCHNRHVQNRAEDSALLKTRHEIRLAHRDLKKKACLKMLRKQAPDLYLTQMTTANGMNMLKKKKNLKIAHLNNIETEDCIVCSRKRKLRIRDRKRTKDETLAPLK